MRSVDNVITCQLLFVDHTDGQVLLDFVPLESVPAENGDGCLDAGTPMTLAFGDNGDGAVEPLVEALQEWTIEGAVCEMRAVAVGDVRRLVIAGGDRCVVVDVAA